MSFFRYPGGKQKIKNLISSKILNILSEKPNLEYREPFFGGGSIGLDILSKHDKKLNVYINDKDLALACLWSAVINHSEELKERVLKFVPSVDMFNKYKSTLMDEIIYFDIDNKDFVVEYGFMKLAVHQTSFSGLGTKSGGPLGGKKQKSIYKIDCRWSPKYICDKIDKINLLFKKHNIKNNACCSYDFEEVLRGDNFITYLDPPYFVKGDDLYQFSFTFSDHVRLRDLLKNLNVGWVLSYDDCKEIRSLYDWATLEEIEVSYSIKNARVKKELLIYGNL